MLMASDGSQYLYRRNCSNRSWSWNHPFESATILGLKQEVLVFVVLFAVQDRLAQNSPSAMLREWLMPELHIMLLLVKWEGCYIWLSIHCSLDFACWRKPVGFPVMQELPACQVLLKLKQTLLIILAHVEGCAGLTPQIYPQASAHLLKMLHRKSYKASKGRVVAQCEATSAEIISNTAGFSSCLSTESSLRYNLTSCRCHAWMVSKRWEFLIGTSKVATALQFRSKRTRAAVNSRLHHNCITCWKAKTTALYASHVSGKSLQAHEHINIMYCKPILWLGLYTKHRLLI